MDEQIALLLPDVNVLLHSHRRSTPESEAVQEWFVDAVNSRRAIALSDQVIAGFVRVATNPKAYHPPTPLSKAIEFVDGLITQPNCTIVGSGPLHWEILRETLMTADARGNLVTDANIAALAIEYGFTIITRDRDFARFDNIRWLDPLDVEQASSRS